MSSKRISRRFNNIIEGAMDFELALIITECSDGTAYINNLFNFKFRTEMVDIYVATVCALSNRCRFV